MACVVKVLDKVALYIAANISSIAKTNKRRAACARPATTSLRVLCNGLLRPGLPKVCRAPVMQVYSCTLRCNARRSRSDGKIESCTDLIAVNLDLLQSNCNIPLKVITSLNYNVHVDLCYVNLIGHSAQQR